MRAFFYLKKDASSFLNGNDIETFLKHSSLQLAVRALCRIIFLPVTVFCEPGPVPGMVTVNVNIAS